MLSSGGLQEAHYCMPINPAPVLDQVRACHWASAPTKTPLTIPAHNNGIALAHNLSATIHKVTSIPKSNPTQKMDFTSFSWMNPLASINIS
jgi:hypothetical protein